MSITSGGPDSEAKRGLGRDFWWVFAASTCLTLVNGAAAALLARYALHDLGATAGTVGLLVGSASVVAIVMRPVLGRLADRNGLRRVTAIAAVTLAFGLIVMMLAANLVTGTVARLVIGLSTAASTTALLAWVVALVPTEQRGRALGIFGVSVWAGLAVGPQFGQVLVSLGGYPALWIGCAVLGLGSGVCAMRARAPRIEVEPGRPPRHPVHLIKLVGRPGAASMIAWAGEGLIITFLVVTLEGRGLGAGGIDGAVSVFTVFAISVIVARVLLAGLVDRFGATPTAAVALFAIGLGLGTLAVARSFPIAAVGAVLLGLGFAPLFPSLALLATERLNPDERASGIGVFSSFIDAGMAIGSILGGVLIAAVGSTATFGVLAAAQLVAMVLVLGGPQRPVSSRSSNRAGFETNIASTAASETPPA
ncbi:MAG: MFS transporter [Actinobacteria bacterium]|nr:MFS transporter [Actinomycetota bacterium]